MLGQCMKCQLKLITNIYLQQGGYVLPGVCLFVCLSVSLLATSRKNYRRNLHENLSQTYLCTKKSPLRAGSHTDTKLDADSGYGRILLGGGVFCPSALVLKCND